MKLPVNSSPIVVPGFEDSLDGSEELFMRVLRKFLLVFGVEIFYSAVSIPVAGLGQNHGPFLFCFCSKAAS